MLVSGLMLIGLGWAIQVPSVRTKLDFEKPIALAMASVPVKFNGQDIPIVRFTSVIFDKEPVRLELESPILLPVSEWKPPPGVYGVRWGYFPKPPEPEPLKVRAIPGPFLKARLSIAVTQLVPVDYRISAALFDRQGRLLGASSHIEKVQCIRVPLAPTVYREVELDFGGSKAYERAASVAFSISQPDLAESRKPS